MIFRTRVSFVRSGVLVAVLAAATLLPLAAAAQTEFHYQYGRLVNPFSGERAVTSILTIQDASSWSLGDSFLFVDLLDDRTPDGFNDLDLYGEWYPTLSLGKLAQRRVGAGPVRDVALVGGINFDADADFFRWLPGVRLSWDAPGFAFLNTDLTAFAETLAGYGDAPAAAGGGYMFDVSWGGPFAVGGQLFWFTGHAEYVRPGARLVDDVFERGQPWILAQPQLGWDVGQAFGGNAGEFFLGVEYQYWKDKLGVVGADDNVAQLWVMWRL